MFLLWLRHSPWCGDWTPASVPLLAEGRSSPTNTLFSPLVPCPTEFCMVLCILFHWPGTPVHSLLFCRRSAVLHALLCLEVYSWCIHGERCTPHPPTPSPSCFPGLVIFLSLSCKISWHILDRSPFSDISFASIFSHFGGCLFTLLVVSFADASLGVSISSWKYIKYAD